MNQQMWANAATQANVAVLKERGVHLFGPGSGDQACGEVGAGRMLEPNELAALADSRLTHGGVLSGQRVLITAGPTREPIDPVRFISNRSSGKMGFAVAQAAREAGAEVVMICGPVSLATPAGVRRVDVESAADMLVAVQAEVRRDDIFISTAAVADYRPAQAATQKIKKTEENLALQMARTTDIIGTVAASANRPAFVVGFAAETDTVEQNARSKMLRKNLDMIAANEVGHDKVFDCADNELIVLWRNGRKLLPRNAKTQLARELIELIAAVYAERRQDAAQAESLLATATKG
jgi:phosphopantothenoylcysteine decarboxylase/phosphopantothenate--cysteine ligase